MKCDGDHKGARDPVTGRSQSYHAQYCAAWRQRRREQAEAAIAIVPSIWQEPAGRVVLEALSSGCALITTRRGGIPEYAEGRSIILDDVTPETIKTALENLITQDNDRLSWQNKAITDYPYTLKAAGEQLDQGRSKISAI